MSTSFACMETTRNGNLSSPSLFDQQAEEGLVGCLLMDPWNVAPLVFVAVSQTDFCDVELGQVFDAVGMLALAGTKQLGDPKATLEQLRKNKIAIPWEVLARAYICATKIGNYNNAAYFAERVSRLAKLRKLYIAIRTAITSIDSETDPNDVAAAIEATAIGLQSIGKADSAKALSDCWDDTIAELKILAASNRSPAIMSGLYSADAAGFVFVRGELTILAARPGCGKTTLAVQILKHHAEKGKTTFFASLEMSQGEVAMRTLMAEAGIDYHFVRSRGADAEIIENAIGARQSAGNVPLIVWSPQRRATVGQIYAAARLAQQRHELSLIAVDYIGLIKADDLRAERRYQIGDICQALREMGKRLNVPVIALCQLNRAAEKDRPRLNNLADSGDIEKHADIVAMLHRVGEQRDAKTELIIEKCRHGPGGIVELIHDGSLSQFIDPRAPKAWEFA